MVYTTLTATDGVTSYTSARDQYIQNGIGVAHALLGQLNLNVLDPQWGVTGNGTTDDRPAIQAVLDAAAAAGIPSVYFPPGIYVINSVSVSNGGYPDPLVAGALTFGLTVPPGVSVLGAGSGRTTLKMTATGNVLMVRSTLSTTISTITINVAQGDNTFTVDSTTGWSIGDIAATHVTQNVSDAQEARWTVFASVIGVTSTTITLDTPAEWAMDTSNSLAVNRRITKVTAVAEKMRFGGFHIQGSASLRHGIGVMWARHLQFQDLTGYDVGSGIINAQFCSACSGRDITVYKSGAYTNPSKGRGISVSNGEFTIDNFATDNCDAASLYVESYSKVRVNGWRIANRSISRSTAYLIFSGVGCEVSSNGLTVSGWNPAAPGADSIVSFGPSDGKATFHNTTLYMQLSQIRAFPLHCATGLFRCLDNTGVLRTWNMNRVEKSTVQITLTDGATKTAWLRDGLIVGYEAAVPSGVVASGGLTTLSVARVGVGSVAIPWQANRNVRVDGWCGDVVYPVQSAWTQAVRIQAITAASAGLTGTVLNVTVYTVIPTDYVTTLDEPGSSQIGRFGASYAV